jgi:hypothetical protein
VLFYCEEDIEWAQWIDSELQVRFGFSVMARYTYLEYGDVVPERIREVRATNPNVLLLVSSKSAECNCMEHQFEIEHLRNNLELGNRVVPVLLSADAVVPVEFKKLAPINFFHAATDEEAARLLLSGLEERQRARNPKPAFPGRPAAVASRKRSPTLDPSHIDAVEPSSQGAGPSIEPTIAQEGSALNRLDHPEDDK